MWGTGGKQIPSPSSSLRVRNDRQKRQPTLRGGREGWGTRNPTHAAMRPRHEWGTQIPGLKSETCHPSEHRSLAGDPAWGTRSIFRREKLEVSSVVHLRRSGFQPPARSVRLGSTGPGRGTRVRFHRSRRRARCMGRPSLFRPTLRTRREGWGTRAVYIPPFAEDAKDGAPARKI